MEIKLNNKQILFIIVWIIVVICGYYYISNHKTDFEFRSDQIEQYNNVTYQVIYKGCPEHFKIFYTEKEMYQKGLCKNVSFEKPPLAYYIYQVQLKYQKYLNILKYLAIAYIIWFAYYWRKQIMNIIKNLEEKK